jgi:hypothetical protein
MFRDFLMEKIQGSQNKWVNHMYPHIVSPLSNETMNLIYKDLPMV